MSVEVSSSQSWQVLLVQLDHKMQGFKERGTLDESPECHIGVLLRCTWSIISCR